MPVALVPETEKLSLFVVSTVIPLLFSANMALLKLQGIVMLARLVQVLNAPAPILVTLEGIVMLARLAQP